MKNLLNLEPETWEIYESVQDDFIKKAREIDKIEEYNSLKVMNAFWQNHVCENDFNMTTGYGYGDIGRERVEMVYKTIFKCESALVRNQFVSGSHALTKTFFGILRPGDTLLSITGTPYDTLHEVIGIVPNASSLKSFGVFYDEIDLVNNDFDYVKIEDYLRHKKVKMIEIQRSIGYSNRKTIDILKLEKVIKLIKEIDSSIVVMVDNCYCEFVGFTEPSEVGADLVVGSLIKNLGGGIASNGAYVVGKEKYVKLVSEALTLPGEGSDVGPSLGANKQFLQGIFMAPSVVASALKTALLTSLMLEKLGVKTSPNASEIRSDIVQTITFNNPDDLILYCKGIQDGSPVDAFVKPVEGDMPGYQDKIIMASGAFTQGSSIELSCDGPLREPYIAYQQGGLTFHTAKFGVLKAINELIKKRKEGR